MGNLIATFTNPQQNYAGTGASTAVSIDGRSGFAMMQEINVVSTANFFISSDITDLYGLETTATNAVQKNSTISVTRDALTWFNGYVNRKAETIEAPDGRKYLQVEAYGKDGILLDSFCRRGGRDIWSIQTSSFPFTLVVLKSTRNYGSFQGSTLWPDPADSDGIRCYLHDSVANNDTLAVNIGTGTYAITAVNQGTKTFSVADNVAPELTAGLVFEISGSTGNDGDYTVVSATWTGAQTDVVVAEAIPDATVDGNLVNESIALSAANQGFLVRGWVKITTVGVDEWIYHDGYDDAEDDGIWRLRGCKRGELGTVAAAHLATTTVYEKLTKQMAPGIVKLENLPPTETVWLEMKYEEGYKVNYGLCCFILPFTATGDYRASFSVYDEDKAIGTHAVTAVNQGTKTFTTASDLSSELYAGDPLDILGSTGNDGTYTVVTVTWTGAVTNVVVSEAIPDATADGSMITTVIVSVNDIVEALLTIPVAYQGPGLSTGDLDLNCSRFLVNRYDYDPVNRPKYVWDAIQEVIAQLEIDEEVGFFYDHKLDKFRLIVMGNDTPAFTAPWSTRIEKQDSLEQLASAIRIEYDLDQDMNRVSEDHSWHSAATGADNKPSSWRYAKYGSAGYGWHGPALVDFIVAAGSEGFDYIADGKEESKFGAVFEYKPTGTFEFGHFWFGDPVANIPPIINVNEITVRCGNAREVNKGKGLYNDTDQYEILFEACTNYNTSTHTGTWKSMGVSGKAAIRSSEWYNVDEFKFTRFALPQCNAVRMVWNYMPGGGQGASSPIHQATVHDLIILASMTTTGGSKSFITVELSDNPLDKNDATKIYAPASFQKLRGGVGASVGVPGVQHCEHYPIDVASDRAAVSLARYRLLTKLRKSQEREYEYRGFLPGIPRLGITIGVDENNDGAADYTGLLRSHSIVVGSDGIMIRYSVLDYDAAVVT